MQPISDTEPALPNSRLLTRIVCPEWNPSGKNSCGCVPKFTGRRDITRLQRVGIGTASAEALLDRMLKKIDELCAERDRLKAEQPNSRMRSGPP